MCRIEDYENKRHKKELKIQKCTRESEVNSVHISKVSGSLMNPSASRVSLWLGKPALSLVFVEVRIQS